MVAKIIHDGALRGPDLSDDELKQKIKATEGGTDFEESEMVSLYSFILSTLLLKRLNSLHPTKIYFLMIIAVFRNSVVIEVWDHFLKFLMKLFYLFF